MLALYFRIKKEITDVHCEIPSIDPLLDQVGIGVGGVVGINVIYWKENYSSVSDSSRRIYNQSIPNR